MILLRPPSNRPHFGSRNERAQDLEYSPLHIALLQTDSCCVGSARALTCRGRRHPATWAVLVRSPAEEGEQEGVQDEGEEVPEVEGESEDLDFQLQPAGPLESWRLAAQALQVRRRRVQGCL